MTSSISTLLSEDNEKLREAAIQERLDMTAEQRIEAHENARELLNDLKNAGEVQRAKSESAS